MKPSRDETIKSISQMAQAMSFTTIDLKTIMARCPVDDEIAVELYNRHSHSATRQLIAKQWGNRIGRDNVLLLCYDCEAQDWTKEILFDFVSHLALLASNIGEELSLTVRPVENKNEDDGLSLFCGISQHLYILLDQ